MESEVRREEVAKMHQYNSPDQTFYEEEESVWEYEVFRGLVD
jgi:hypothetical protein